MYYKNFRARLKGGYFVREPVPSYQIHGKKGSFLKTRADVQETSLQAKMKPDVVGYGMEPVSEQGLLHTEKNGVIIRERVPTLSGNYMNYFEGMHRAITANMIEPVTADDGIRVMRIIEAGFQSNASGKVISIV
jgi:predicted dehydrogenase